MLWYFTLRLPRDTDLQQVDSGFEKIEGILQCSVLEIQNKYEGTFAKTRAL